MTGTCQVGGVLISKEKALEICAEPSDRSIRFFSQGLACITLPGDCIETAE